MDDSNLIEKYNKRIKDIESIFKLHELGYTPLETEWKIKVASSYIIECLKNGKEKAISETSQQYNFILEDIPKEKSSPKKIDKVDKPHPSTNQELLCMDCVQVLQQIDAVVFNDYTFRMFRCQKCKKAYPHPLDSQGYLGKDST